jgi:hypothetical protein
MTASSDPARPVFPGPLFETVRWDYAAIAPRFRTRLEGEAPQPEAGAPARPRRRLGDRAPRDEWLVGLLLQEAVRQRCTRVQLQDVHMACLCWGGDRSRWPALWRTALLQSLRRVLGAAAPQHPRRFRRGCHARCPLRAGEKHGHVDVVVPEDLLGGMRFFAFAGWRDQDSFYLRLDRQVPRSEARKKLQARLLDLAVQCVQLGNPPALVGKCRRTLAAIQRIDDGTYRHIMPVLLLPLLLGKAAGLSRDAVNILLSAFRERRRPEQEGWCSLNGTDNYGYRLQTRFERAGFEKVPAWTKGALAQLPAAEREALQQRRDKLYWDNARDYLGELQLLSAELGLRAEAHRKGEVVDLGTALARAGSAEGRRWLQACTVHIFAPLDFESRWRRWFLARAGFDPDAPARRPGAEPFVTDGDRMRDWLYPRKLKQKQAASLLGVSPSWISTILSGKRAMSAHLRAKMEQAGPAPASAL